MLDKQKDIDAIIVATPDHMHASIASRRWMLGKHVYVQKPLCWSVHEARHLAKKAKDNPKVVTQMGNQGHSRDEARRGYEYITSGAIGDVREVHVWTNRPLGYWPQGVPRPAPLPARAGSGDGSLALERGRTSTPALAAALDGQLSPYRSAVVGSVPRRRAAGRVPPDLSPVQLARLGGLGPGRARRHGRAPHRSSVLVAQARDADDHRDDLDAVQRRPPIRSRRRRTTSSRRAAACRR